MVNLLGLFFGILGVILGVLSPWINERYIQPYRFRKAGGRDISGTYFSVWYTKVNNPPVTWEIGVISQVGKNVNFRSKDNDSDFDYEFIGVIDDDIISGHWKSKVEGEKVRGGGILHFTNRGHICGMWLGDCQVKNVSWGYWAISKDEEALKRFVAKMQSEVKFNNADLVHLFD